MKAINISTYIIIYFIYSAAPIYGQQIKALSFTAEKIISKNFHFLEILTKFPALETLIKNNPEFSMLSKTSDIASSNDIQKDDVNKICEDFIFSKNQNDSICAAFDSLSIQHPLLLDSLAIIMRKSGNYSNYKNLKNKGLIKEPG